MFTGQLLAIAVAPAAKAALEVRDQAEAVAGQGLVDDRYSLGKGAFQGGESEILPRRQVTLIEREAIEAAAADYELEFTHADTRRNLLTADVPLNHLVGREFRVGEAVLRGVKLCEPCSYLESLTCNGIEKALLHRGGLRAQVVKGGVLRVGDSITPVRDGDG